MPAFLDFQVTEGIPLGVFEAHHQEEELLQGLWLQVLFQLLLFTRPDYLFFSFCFGGAGGGGGGGMVRVGLLIFRFFFKFI